MTALLNQVSLALEHYPTIKNGALRDSKKDVRIPFDFLVRDKKIMVDVHTKSFTIRDPEIALRIAKIDEERSVYKKQLAAKYKYTYIEIRSPEDIAAKLSPCLIPKEDSR